MTALTYRRALHARLPRATSTRAGPVERLGALVPFPRAMPALERGYRSLGAIIGSLVAISFADGPRTVAALGLGAWLGARGGAHLVGRSGRAAAGHARDALPLLLDRLATCVMAGMSMERALRTVTPGTAAPLRDALIDGLRGLDVGMPRATIYERIAARGGGEELRRAMVVLARAERTGSSVADTLVALAREMLSRARAAAESEARTAPVKMLFPLALCFLPAFVLLTIVPIGLSALRTLGDL